ncbi:hypothetical protein L1276_000965 [Flavobacterium sp. HSC-32F16]|uniref:hypothetical protein n=1 Tax=Flavobacterium sp. HSC-32F16 TaxID=2910964 RepID=UPI003531D08C|nr:hypothetical protein [Flavobacterium sp. HSC-32F16]
MTKEVYSFITIAAPLEEVFPYFFSLNPTVVLQELWLVPRTDKNILENSCAQPGSELSIYFEDGSMALYQLFSLVPLVSFSVHVDDFTSKRFKGLYAMRCHFSFLQLESGKIMVECHCQFNLGTRLHTILFDLFLKRIIQKKLDADLVFGAKELLYLIAKKNWLGTNANAF